VGPDDRAEEFLVQESIICASSARVHDCLTRPCKEEKEGRIFLPRFDPATFRTYMQFLHTGLIYTIRTEVQSDSISAGSLVLNNDELARCLRMYQLANYLEAPDFKDATVDAVIEIVTDLRFKYPSTDVFLTEESVKFLYKCSTPDSPVRTLIVDWGLVAVDHTGFDPHKEFHDDDQFLCDLFVAVRPFWMGKKGPSELPDPFNGETSCKYHEHQAAGKPCYKEKFGF
jgi:hypothetical protein